MSDVYDVAKKIAKKKIKTAGEIKHIKDTTGYNVARENLDGFSFNEKGLKSVAKTYNHLAEAFSHMVKASNIFSRLKSSQVSPDGKLGGRGYIQPIKEIRTSMGESLNVISELIDTFYDEVNSPYWKKQIFEDNPLVKDILEKTDNIIDKAEEEISPEINEEIKESVATENVETE